MAIEEIPNLPDELVPVIRQREQNIFGISIYIYIYILVHAGICNIAFSNFLCVLFAILFAVFFSLYIKLNGDYMDLEVANAILIEENEILTNRLQSLLTTIEEEEVKEEEAPPLLGFITVDSDPNHAFRKYIWNSTGNSYEYSGSSMSTFSTYPRRGEMNNRRIYVLPDRYSSNIGFYDLSSFGTSPVIRSQSGVGGYNGGSCGFMDDDIVICATYNQSGDIYKYNITNDYEQVKIADNNPSGMALTVY